MITFIAVAGVALGVASLLAVMSITSGFQQEFRNKVLGVNAHVIVLKYGLDFNEYREVIENALPTVGFIDPEKARVVQIADTLHLGEVLVSESCLAEVAERDDLELIDGPFDMPFDESGNLAPVGVTH